MSHVEGPLAPNLWQTQEATPAIGQMTASRQSTKGIGREKRENPLKVKIGRDYYCDRLRFTADRVLAYA